MKTLLAKYVTALKFVLLIAGALNVSVLHAEYFGSLTGRTANFSAHPKMSVEGTFSTGEFVVADYQQMGIRLNYQYAPGILLFGDLGQSELGAQSENSFGVGGYYSLGESILGSKHSAVKVSLHKVSFGKSVSSARSVKCSGPAVVLDINLDFQPGTASCTPGRIRYGNGGDIQNIAIEYLISGELSSVMPDSNASWYANGGVQMFSGDYVDDTVIGFGAGVVVPFNSSEVYAGLDYADEMSFGIGFRYFLQ